MSNFFDMKARRAAAAAGSGSQSKSQQQSQNRHTQPWVEKYRPKSLNDVTAQDHTVEILKRTLQSSNLPHMLFYGPPGTGKTSTILALAKELYGPEMVKSRVLELNASDERGISIVREKVKDFARMQLTNAPSSTAADRTPSAADFYKKAGSTQAGKSGEAGNLQQKKKYPCPPFKLIILDEADSMTQDAQAALRRTMETYSRITRFCLVCNYVTRIIDPLASRCSKFRFKSLDGANARARLEEIAASEGVLLADGAVDALVRTADGDLRKAVTFLQSAARLAGAGATESKETAENDADIMDVDQDEDSGGVKEKTKQEPITTRMVEEIAGVVPNATIATLVETIKAPAIGGGYDPVAKAVDAIVADGWSAGQVVAQLFQEMIVADELIKDKHKIKMLAMFGEVDKRLVDGADEHLSMLNLALCIRGVLAGK